jgi:endonuclease G, mitochondrial
MIAMPVRSLTLMLDIADDGSVTLRQPGGGQQLVLTDATPKAAPPKPPVYNVPFDTDYSSGGPRKGYDPDFLGAANHIALPDLGALADQATLRTDAGASDPHRLDYFGYSVVMHAKRRFALYTAANVDGAHRFGLKRPRDVWRFDPRIPESAQIGADYYANNNFDKGHLTRYEDMQYGSSPVNALATAADTLHWTNCTPQQAKFNETRTYWQGLEQDILEQSIEAKAFAAQVFTGPVLAADDPVWDRFPDIQYPLKFWKIAIALTSDNALFAAGFVLDQSEAIDQYGIEPKDVPFAPFKTYQTSIAEIARLTGLGFTMRNGESLSDADPLKDGPPGGAKAMPAGDVPAGYVLIEDASDIIRPAAHS